MLVFMLRTYTFTIHHQQLLKHFWEYAALPLGSTVFSCSALVVVLALWKLPSSHTSLTAALLSLSLISSNHRWICYHCYLGVGSSSLWQTHSAVTQCLKAGVGYMKCSGTATLHMDIIFLLPVTSSAFSATSVSFNFILQVLEVTLYRHNPLVLHDML